MMLIVENEIIANWNQMILSLDQYQDNLEMYLWEWIEILVTPKIKGITLLIILILVIKIFTKLYYYIECFKLLTW